jgi:hypothetical protein
LISVSYQLIVLFLTSADKKTKDKNGNELPSYHISKSLNVVGTIIIDKWVDPKTKGVYTLVKLNKKLMDQYNK